MSGDEDIITTINSTYSVLTAAEKRIADHVLAHRTEVQFMSISELAVECGVVESTITKFCRRLSLKGYAAFKLAMARATAEEEHVFAEPAGGAAALYRRVYREDTAAISESLALLDPESVNRAVDLLTRAERIYCMGQGASSIIANETAHLFFTVMPQCFFVQGSHVQAARAALFTEKDVLLFFCYSGATTVVEYLLGLAQSRGAKTILITRHANSPAAAHADVILQCGSRESPLNPGSIPARMAQLYIIDVLYNAFVERMPEQSAENLERVANALTEIHL